MLENLWNQEGEQAMNQAPAPVAPVADAYQGASSPDAAPSPQVSFDVNKNPQDMQFMTDAMMYVPMLQQMDPEQRKEKWPQMVDSLSQVSPKASALFDPSIPPSNKDIEELMANMQPKQDVNGPKPIQLASNQDNYNQEQVKRQLKGEKPESLIEYNARMSGEEQRKQEEEAKAKQLQTALNDNNYKDSTEELIFKGAMLTNQAAKYMSAGLNLTGTDSKIQPGYRLDPNDPNKQQYIPGSAADPAVIQAHSIAQKQSGNAPTAGQIALARMAHDALPSIERLPWTKDWDLDTTALTASQFNVYPRVMDALSGVTGRPDAGSKAGIYTQLTDIFGESALKLATGATSNQKEDAKYTDRMFKCNAGDNSDSCLQKTLNARSFIRNLPETLKDVPVSEQHPNGKAVDWDKVQKQNSKIEINTYQYKQDWAQRMLQKYPNITKQQLDRVWVKSIITDPEFANKVANGVEPNKGE